MSDPRRIAASLKDEDIESTYWSIINRHSDGFMADLQTRLWGSLSEDENETRQEDRERALSKLLVKGLSGSPDRLLHLTSNGMTGLHIAVQNEELEIVKTLLQHPAVNPNIRSSPKTSENFLSSIDAGLVGPAECPRGATPLMIACWSRSDNTEIVNELIDAGADVNLRAHISTRWVSKARNGMTALHLAVLNGSTWAAPILLARGANVNLEDSSGKTPLDHAINQADDGIAFQLCGFGANNAPGNTFRICSGNRNIQRALTFWSNDETANIVSWFAEKRGTGFFENPKHLGDIFFAAIDDDNLDVVKYCIEVGDYSQELYPCIVRRAAESGSLNVIKLMSSRGADIDVPYKRRTPLLQAVWRGHDSVVKYLVDSGARVDYVDHDVSYSPLYCAASLEKVHILEHLLASPTPFEIDHINANNEGTPLHGVAINQGNVQMAELLRAKGSKIDFLDKSRCTPLHVACGSGHIKLVDCLLGMEADINSQTVEGFTPIFHAIQSQSYQIVELLINRGANVNHIAKGFSPLALCANANISKLLMERGADVNVKVKCGNNTKLECPFVLACILGGMFDIAEMAIEKGAAVGATVQFSESNTTPLHVVAGSGYIDLAQWLIDKEFQGRVDEPDSYGASALHVAARAGHKEMVELLLNNGANPNFEAGSPKRTPLLKAAEEGHHHVVQVLLRWGVDGYARMQDDETAVSLAAKGGHEKVLTIVGDWCKKNFPPRMASSTIETPSAFRSNAEEEPETTSAPDFVSNEKARTRQVTADFDGWTSEHAPGQPKITDGKTLKQIIKVWDTLSVTEVDEPVKVAILDTGIDLDHPDFHNSSALQIFDGEAKAAEHRIVNTPQNQRVKKCRNFISDDEKDVRDIDGHGTKVAGIILRLVPNCVLYVARICQQQTKGIKAENVEQAILWALSEGVDVINMSFGFPSPHSKVRAALQEAKQKTVVFAAMSNAGNHGHELGAWPARESELVIGIHSSNDHGTRGSDFTPPPRPQGWNFMTVGENIPVHSVPFDEKGTKFCLANGTSFATPVAVSIAALILTFVRQDSQKTKRKEIMKTNNGLLDEVRLHYGMMKVFRNICQNPVDQGRSFISPKLLWSEFPKSQQFGQGHIPDDPDVHGWHIIDKAYWSS